MPGNVNSKEVKEAVEKFSRKIKPALGGALSNAFDKIGIRSQATYWRKVGGPPIPEKLTARSTRLIRSLAPQGGSRHGGRSSEQIRNIKTRAHKIIGEFGTKVPYAKIHEFGGTFVHPNLFGRGISAKITMPARPYLRPAAADELPDIRKDIADEFAKAWPK